MLESEFENAIADVKDAVKNIVAETEKFTEENILNGGFFSFGGWNDSCGKKISKELISTAKDALDKNLNYYDCARKLDKIKDKIRPLIPIIEAAKKELQ